ncbi:SURF1 family protein [Undibacterium sp. Rencai35W]|uniref:SURF1 family protein n=1 Tax=Undibacterium sp. Rencai35W TaxID=3413046 RepID=UPI003BF36F00
MSLIESLSAAPSDGFTIKRNPSSSSGAWRWWILCILVAITLGFIALGTWQIYRLQWKLDLTQRVEQRVHAPAQDAPGCNTASTITAQSDEYRHVRVSGNFVGSNTTRNILVLASTELGRGYWVITPFEISKECVVLINRGFVSEKNAAIWQQESVKNSSASIKIASDQSSSSNKIVVTGLLRISEPDGTFLRANKPTERRWYSRDVAAMAASFAMSHVAPYFIDMDATPEAKAFANTVPGATPAGGLTVIQFHNNHLVYAIVWYLLALMTCFACFILIRQKSNHGDSVSS